MLEAMAGTILEVMLEGSCIGALPGLESDRHAGERSRSIAAWQLAPRPVRDVRVSAPNAHVCTKPARERRETGSA